MVGEIGNIYSYQKDQYEYYRIHSLKKEENFTIQTASFFSFFASHSIYRSIFDAWIFKFCPFSSRQCLLERSSFLIPFFIAFS